MHGWGISQRIQQVSDGVLEVNQGSLYPALQRLEKEGLIMSEAPLRCRLRSGSPHDLTWPDAFGGNAGTATQGLFTPEKAMRSATVKSPGVAEGRIGVNPPVTFRYELASRLSIRTNVSATMRPPTGPS